MKHFVLIVLLMLGACSVPSAEAEREAQAQRVFEAVRAEDRAGLDGMMTDRIRPELTDDVWDRMSGYVPTAAPVEAKTVAWQSNTTNGQSAYRIVRQYSYPDTTVTVDTVMVREAGGAWEVDGVHVNGMSAAEVALGQFSLVNKSPLHYGVLVLTVLAPIICLATAVIAGLRRRWGWMIGSLFGVGQFVFNWGTGSLQFQALNFAVLGAGFSKGPLATDPWIFAFAIPIPALLFWGLKKWKPKRAREAKSTTSSPDST